MIGRNEGAKCQSLVDKYVSIARNSGSRAQYKKALRLHLPTSPLYDFLEGLIPHPSHTYRRLIEISEAEEKELINREIGERRTRLGARIEQVTLEVKREVFRNSDLDDLYRGILDWSNEDETRREYEEKLLLRSLEHLKVLPADKKADKRKAVIQLAHGMVIIKHPFVLAWRIVLDWEDTEELAGLNINTIGEFIKLFPDDGFSKVLRGFVYSEISPFSREEVSKTQDEEAPEKEEKLDDLTQKVTEDERLLLMAEGLEQTPPSVLSHRIMAELYLTLGEYQTAVDIGRKALVIIAGLQNESGLKLTNAVNAVKGTLATALIFYQSPRNHPEAKQIFEDVLKRVPTSTRCLLGIGLILEQDHDYASAVDTLDKALQRDPSNVKIASELYWCKAHNGELNAGLQGLQESLFAIKFTQQRSQELKAEILYRIGDCQWKLDTSPAARKDRSGAYASFLGAIQANMNYAPAYTSLGIFYADYKQDQRRAHRCFHKAFELSSQEVEAAERLARGFAERGEWELVEAVSQRVVDSGRARPAPGSKRKGYSWPYTALGVVEVNRQQYPKAIVNFQAALRISPNDYQSWVGLGESYHNSGRYIAATKAFQHAETLEVNLPVAEREQIWFSRYMLANVKRELGDYEDAISSYEEVLNMKPHEFGVSIALLQTLTERAWKSVELGLYGEAAENTRKAIETGLTIAQHHPDVFNLWKTIGDAFSIFSWIRGKTSFMPIAEFRNVVETQMDQDAFSLLEDVDDVGTNLPSLLLLPDEGGEMLPNMPMYAAILAYKIAIYIASSEKHAQAVAWYNLGWAEYRAHTCQERNAPGPPKAKQRGFLKASMRCFKRAIELEAGNSEFWNALGVTTTTLNPKVAQHSFVRSLHLNDRNAQVWTNIGALYLLNNEHQLANEAFTRAQSADPDFSHAWLGQGLLALLLGDPTEARDLFTHAFEISNSSLAFPKRQYSLSVFDYVTSDHAVTLELPQLIRPLFALHQLHCQTPANLPFEHLSALLAERIGDFSDAHSRLEIVCSGVESEYEISESPSALLRFAQAKADTARVQLAELSYQDAADNAETALSLSSEDGVGELDFEIFHKLRLSAHLTAGLSHYYLKDMDRAIDMFRSALQEADSSPDVICLLAQVLWAKGGEEEKNVAREQLFDCVERHPDHVGAVTLLGVIAILDGDEDAIEAVKSDLQEMRLRKDLGIYEKTKVTQLLTGISAMGFAKESDIPEDLRQIHEANTSIMLAPWQPHGWMALSTVSSESHPADMALQTALRSIPPKGMLDATDLCKAYSVSGRRENALMAIMVAPWIPDGWKELNRALS